MPLNFVEDAPDAEDYALIIGRFMMNFGALEAVTIEWSRRVAEDRDELGGVIQNPFAKRVKWIMKRLPSTPLSESQRKDARAMWSEAKEFAKLRNEIAHNPIARSGSGEEGEERPGGVSLLRLRTAHGEFLELVEGFDLTKLGPINDELVALARRIQPLLKSLQQPLGKR